VAGGRRARACAEAFARRLAALEEGAIRSGAAGRHLAALEPAAALELLDVLVATGEEGWSTAAVAAVGQALRDPGSAMGYEWRVAVYAAARERGLAHVAALFLAPRPRRRFEEPRDKADPAAARLTLGHKKSFARLRRDPDLLARLAAEGDPAVVRELLRNPLVTEAVAVRIASRRPARPETLRALFEDRRFRTRPAVRRALARNPYVETEIALHVLPTLPARLVGEIAGDATLHPAVREAAGRLREERRVKRGGGA
jgi:DNA-directed RNA polymerase subunit F